MAWYVDCMGLVPKVHGGYWIGHFDADGRMVVEDSSCSHLSIMGKEKIRQAILAHNVFCDAKALGLRNAPFLPRFARHFEFPDDDWVPLETHYNAISWGADYIKVATAEFDDSGVYKGVSAGIAVGYLSGDVRFVSCVFVFLWTAVSGVLVSRFVSWTALTTVPAPGQGPLPGRDW